MKKTDDKQDGQLATRKTEKKSSAINFAKRSTLRFHVVGAERTISSLAITIHDAGGVFSNSAQL